MLLQLKDDLFVELACCDNPDCPNHDPIVYKNKERLCMLDNGLLLKINDDICPICNFYMYMVGQPRRHTFNDY